MSNNTFNQREEELRSYISSLEKNIYTYIKDNSLIQNGRETIDSLTSQKKSLFQNKIDHTMRTVKFISEIAVSLGIDIDFQDVFKTAALLHDYGRFEQALIMGTFNDNNYKKYNLTFIDDHNIKLPVNNHAQHGFKLMDNDKHIDNFHISSIDKPAILKTILYHGDVSVPKHLDYNLQNLFNDNKINDLMMRTNKYNDEEKMIMNLVLRLMQDSDKIDILNMYVTGDIPLNFETLLYYHTDKNLEEIAFEFGMNVSDITDNNNFLAEEDITQRDYFKIPLDKVTNLECLQVPNDFKQRIFNKEAISLREHQAWKDRSFITALWWRISEFINNMNFSASLDVMYTTELLDNIRKQIPRKYQFLFDELFDFAKKNFESYYQIIGNESKVVPKDLKFR